VIHALAPSDHLTRQLGTMAPHRAVLRAVECRLMGAVAAHEPVLDIGCGDGHFASIAYRAAITVGLDVRPAELAEAAARPGVYRAVLGADATRLPFANGSFATVLSNCALEHIADLDQTLAEIGRVLRIGGTFAATLPSEHFADDLLGPTLLRRLRLRRAAEAYGRWFNRISVHHHVYPPAEWERRLAAAGLALVDHQYYFSAPATRAFEACHWLGVPHLVSRKLTGRWVPHRFFARPFECWLAKYYEEPIPQPGGAYQFVLAVRRER
jgi:SAM-dependent methyltransferase